MGQPEELGQRRGPPDFVPEASNQGLLGGPSFAGDQAQPLNFVENSRVLLARQLRGCFGTKFISARQGERSDLRPLCEVRWCKIGRGELVVARLVSRDKRRRSEVRSVGAAER